ncbi:MAG: hypothetical protein GF346_01735 [Candidatus Eisenbacteria bacterium]|nr:hypothetical protein [Candidatus Latescibacterota bacterium]MBD3301152.1 hypothetical protein [Candidatus Eisenbacteria bacterium]
MEFVPSRGQGHLIVASIRVLSHVLNRPPTAAEIAEQLRLSRELVLHILRGLGKRAIVREIENPFDVRFVLDDPAGLEKLPIEAKGPDMGREIDEFHQKAVERQKQIERMMQENDPESKTRKKAATIEEEFKKFRRQKGRSPFREESNDG